MFVCLSSLVETLRVPDRATAILDRVNGVGPYCQGLIKTGERLRPSG
jgi:hypothetical protein